MRLNDRTLRKRLAAAIAARHFITVSGRRYSPMLPVIGSTMPVM